MMKDLQFAWRTLRARPLFAGIAILSLALGIGANTAIFSVVESSLLRGLPYPHADRLVQVGIYNPCCNVAPFSPGEYFDYSHQSKTLSGLAAYVEQVGDTLTGRGDAKALKAVSVTTNYFDVLGAKAELGRLLSPAIDKPGAETRVAVLSDATWRSLFGGDRNIVGQDITLNSHSFRIIGVLKPNQQYPNNGEIFISPRIDVPEFREGPLPTNIAQQYGAHWMTAIGRLRPGYSIAQSDAELKTIAAGIAAQHPDDERDSYAGLTPLQDIIVGQVRPAILTLLVAVVLLLGIACANLAGLLLARASGRTRELALRMALGATRWGMMRLLLAESLLLAVFGGALGIAFAAASIRLLTAYSPYNLPGALMPDLNWIVLAFCAGVTLVSALISGLLPALNAARVNVNTSLKEGSKGSVSGGAHRLRRFLVGGEIAVSVMLLIGAGLLIRSFSKLIDVNPGFAPQNVFSAGLFLPHATYPQDPQVVNFWHDLLQRVDALPGVQSAGLLTNLPMSGHASEIDMPVEGQTYGPGHPAPFTENHTAGPGTFRTLHVPLIQGRLFTERDNAKAPAVVVISKAFAEKVFPHQNPIGKRFVWDAEDLWWPKKTIVSVIGVVGDAKYQALNEKEELDFYTTYAQTPGSSLSLLIRSQPGFGVSAGQLRQVVRHLDANIPLTDVKPLGDYLAQSLAARKFLLGLLTTFSGLAILLAAIGLYAILAYSVQQRKQEIGIRLALGATRSNVLWLILRESLNIAVIGTVVGLVGATWATSFLNSMLYGVTTTDLAAYIAAAAFILAIAIAASLAPAFRATRIDPVTALRYE